MAKKDEPLYPTNTKRHTTHPHRTSRQQAAQLRQTARATFTTNEQLAILQYRPGSSSRETSRLAMLP